MGIATEKATEQTKDNELERLRQEFYHMLAKEKERAEQRERQEETIKNLEKQLQEEKRKGQETTSVEHENALLKGELQRAKENQQLERLREEISQMLIKDKEKEQQRAKQDERMKKLEKELQKEMKMDEMMTSVERNFCDYACIYSFLQRHDRHCRSEQYRVHRLAYISKEGPREVDFTDIEQRSSGAQKGFVSGVLSTFETKQSEGETKNALGTEQIKQETLYGKEDEVAQYEGKKKLKLRYTSKAIMENWERNQGKRPPIPKKRKGQLHPDMISGSDSCEYHGETSNFLTLRAVHTSDDLDAKVNLLTLALQDQVLRWFPTQRIRISLRDKPWMSAKVKQLIRLRQHAFHSKHYPEHRRLTILVKQKISYAKRTFYQTKISLLRTYDPKKWHNRVESNCGIPRTASTFSHITEIAGQDTKEAAKLINS
ncbi:unnamed protein product [Darwinula stevensoni]|uniref:Uncharacterized protein n=1 Tax=Darwinula stevensoni TaxID=69355 RepID=A0A7R9AF96_9CRUS|nr:unnamed protein product [Darwinula stevensoni]CAG0902192.1 unnamed protein product [Darwinula stevensoni]